MMHKTCMYLFATIALLLTACGAAPTDLGGPRSMILSPSGGTLTATAGDGARIDIVFSAGAVTAPVDVTLTPLESTATTLGGFRVDPADLVLEVPAVVTLTLPEGVITSSRVMLAFGGGVLPIHVPTDVQGSTLRAVMPYFTLPDDMWMPGRTIGSAGGGGAGAPPTGAVARAQTEGDSVVAVEASCADQLVSFRAAFDALVATDSFEAAIQVAWTAAGSAALCTDDDQVAAFLEEIPPLACGRYEELVLDADVIAADTYNVFSELVQPVMHWSKVLNDLGVTCDGTKSVDEVITAKFTQFLTFFSGQVSGVAFQGDFERLINEARKAFVLVGRAGLLGLEGAETLLREQVLYPTMDDLRDRGFDECVDTSDHFYLYSLLQTPFTSESPSIGPVTSAVPAGGSRPNVADAGFVARASTVAEFDDGDLHDDLQYCASTLSVAVWSDPDVPEEVVAGRRELGPGDAPGQPNAVAATAGPVEGFVVVRGPIERFKCGFDRVLDDHELVVQFGGIEVDRVSSFGGNPEVDVEASLVAIGRSLEGVNEIDIVVRRESSACQGVYGASEYDLFTITYTADPAPTVTSATVSPAGLVAEQPKLFTFTMPWTDGGKNLSALHMRYDLGGTVETESVDLATSDAISGFEEGGGTGTYQQTLNVFCSEAGKGTILVTMVLEDAYGQRSEERTTTVSVSYGSCPSAGAVDLAGASIGLQVGDTR